VYSQGYKKTKSKEQSPKKRHQGGGLLWQQRMIWKNKNEHHQVLGPSKQAGMKERRALKWSGKPNRDCHGLKNQLPNA